MTHSDAREVRFGRLAVEWHARKDTAELWRSVVVAAVTEVPGAERAAVTTVGSTRGPSPAWSDEVARELQQIQHKLGQGPALAVLTGTETVVRCDDLARESRWPAFTARAGRSFPVASVLSVRLAAATGPVGALTLYAAAPRAFTEAADAAATLAMHAATALSAVEAQENLRSALESRDVIGQAKGILMERHKITADEAFALINAMSQQTHQKVREVAETLAATGELVQLRPGGPGRRD